MVSAYKKLIVVALTATLMIPVASTSAASPTAKKISLSQGKKIYEKAVKATNAWLKNNPSTTAYRSVDSSNAQEVFDNRSVSVDSVGNIFLDEEEDTYLIGENMYVEYIYNELADYELEIALNLDLQVNANFMIMPLSLFGEGYSSAEIRNSFLEFDDPGFTGYIKGAKSTTVAYRKTGTSEYLTVTLHYAVKDDSFAGKRVLFTKIEEGIITANSETVTFPGESYKITTTRKKYSGTIAPPAGPYFEWEKMYLDPRYGAERDKQKARAILDIYVREAKAIAAFEAIGNPTIKEWELVAKGDATVVIYNKGIEFSYSNDDEKRACGVFTEEGADLEMSTCSELNFTKL